LSYSHRNLMIIAIARGRAQQGANRRGESLVVSLDDDPLGGGIPKRGEVQPAEESQRIE